ncbi:MAG: alpha/beta fold hydrolase [Pseudomonadota bacterium]|jgi:alpha-beta hydrolase superfamily lysophospholipase|nr:alpha/beta hydrolase [Alphaproteobacteria bacterium]
MIVLVYLYCLFSTILYSTNSAFEYHELTTPDNVKIRVGRFCGENTISSSDKVLFILPGLVSRIERQEFLAQQLASHGYDIWVLEFRGQGESQRLVSNKQMIHVDDFGQYITDVETLASLKQFQNKQISLYAHSMGGQVALQILKKYPNKFQLAVLEAPMIRINTSPFPLFFAEPMAYIFKNWLGKSKQYCLTCSDYDPIKLNFTNNRNCRDKDLFDQYYYIPESKKEMIPSDPSWGWMYTALTTSRQLLNNLYLLKPITTKIFFATAGNDKVLDTSYDKIVVSSLTKVAHKIYREAYHSLVHDSLAIRKMFLQDISSFLQNPDQFVHETRKNAPSSNDILDWLYKFLHSWTFKLL